MSTRPTGRLLDGLNFAESPRWHEGRLWISDIFDHKVVAVDELGRAEIVLDLTDGRRPSGLGFLPDGRLLVVNLTTPEILRLEPGGELVVHADLSALAVGGLNDMLVDERGRAYVGSMGTHKSSDPRPVDADGVIILVEPDGGARIVAEHLDAPNGPALLDDGRQYVVAEFPAQRLTAFDRSADGSLTNRRTWANLEPGSADGIAADPAGRGVWCASPLTSDCRLVEPGGAIIDVVAFDDRMPLACAVGGADRRTLFVLSAQGGVEAIVARTCTSVIDTFALDLP